MFYRSDESGTTENFEKYLAGAAPSDWTIEPGKAFGGGVGEGREKSAGVSDAVKSTEGAITYVEWSYAKDNKLGVAKVDNGGGAVEPDRRDRRQGRHRGQAGRRGQRPAPQARLHHEGRRHLPDRPRDLRDRLQQGPRPGQDLAREGLPQALREQRRAERPRGASATRRCPPRCRPR
nr:substrate-binding domain-containing protein [Angustibacter aerolatus]